MGSPTITPIRDMTTGGMRELRTTDLAGGGGGGGGGGDASAANQATQIALETSIRDRLPATAPQQGSGPVTAATQRVTLASDGPEVVNSTAIKVATESLDTKTRAFQPTLASGGSLPLAAATTSAAQAVTAGSVLRLGNSGSTAISVEFGTSGVVATASSAIEIMPGTSEAIMVPVGATHFAAYCAQASTLRWIAGTGS